MSEMTDDKEIETEDIGHGRFIWDYRGHGVWKTMNGAWDATNRFKVLMMRALNESNVLDSYDK